MILWLLWNELSVGYEFVHFDQDGLLKIVFKIPIQWIVLDSLIGFYLAPHEVSEHALSEALFPASPNSRLTSYQNPTVLMSGSTVPFNASVSRAFEKIVGLLYLYFLS